MIDNIPLSLVTKLANTYLKQEINDVIPINNSGVSSNVFLITCNSDNYYLKISHNQNVNYSIQKDISLILRQLNVKLPEVVFIQNKVPEIFNRSVIITKKVEGQAISSDQNISDLEPLISDINNIHSLEIDGFGEIQNIESNKIKAKYINYYTYFTQELSNYTKILTQQKIIKKELYDDILNKYKSKLEISKNITQGRLIHGDMGISHFFQDNGIYTGIIDFDDIKSATPFYDYFELSYYDNPIHDLICNRINFRDKYNKYESIFELEKIFFYIEELYYVYTSANSNIDINKLANTVNTTIYDV